MTQKEFIETLQEKISQRTAAAADEAFLEAVYADSRRGETAAFGWSRQQENDFFRMQYRMQKQAYAMQFPGSVCSVVELGATPIGRLIVRRGRREIRLIDIALLAEFRGRGIGRILLEDLQSEAAGEKSLDLRVLKTNPAARRFYERLGFSIVEEADLHFSMQWRKS